MTELDAAFESLPLHAIADAALDRAARLGAKHASVRVGRVRAGGALLRDGVTAGSHDTTHTGLAVSVVCGGTRGFAATTEPTPEAAAQVTERAVAVARACAALGGDLGEPADEPVYPGAAWSSSHRINPFDLPQSEWAAPLAEWSRRLMAAPDVVHVHAKVKVTQENTFYADLAGTTAVQQRVRIHPQLLALGVDPRTGRAETLRTLGPPTARGLEYLTGEGWDWDDEVAGMPAHLGAKLRAAAAEPGRHDLVIDPSNLWLTIHETVGHATELDRALGHELGYAGTTFAAPDRLGSLRYGSGLMNVTADRIAEHGLATVGFDDEGVAAQSWDLVTGGVLTGFQTDRRNARIVGAERSTGCAFAESGSREPLQRMPNVSLRPAPGGPSTADLISGVSAGIYVVGSGSWSIDTRRQNFQFTAQRCHRIRHGRLTGQIRDVAYQGDSTDFWASLYALGGPADYREFGADLCGKGQPVQAAAASHGSPAALFRDVRVLNASQEAAL
ncbi:MULTISPECIES: TldD/PmbA family protein [Thermomonosporaceae]|uniref:TldD/PmbA family protein n=1 Tax=Thermomonosporaceae TaxID=2012 RepID=UPI00255A8790|nr:MULTISPECIES: TldD/PmbA family protein [Thermomonosporaceae]MDL4776716.1 TldD/PmbA family protein [Actinomadura xylanilytica]